MYLVQSQGWPTGQIQKKKSIAGRKKSRIFFNVFFTFGRNEVNFKVLFLKITWYYVKNSTLGGGRKFFLEGHLRPADHSLIICHVNLGIPSKHKWNKQCHLHCWPWPKQPLSLNIICIFSFSSTDDVTVMEEIEDRLNFLDQMKRLGSSSHYDQSVKQEIAKKLKELETIKYSWSGVLNRWAAKLFLFCLESISQLLSATNTSRSNPKNHRYSIKGVKAMKKFKRGMVGRQNVHFHLWWVTTVLPTLWATALDDTDNKTKLFLYNEWII